MTLVCVDCWVEFLRHPGTKELKGELNVSSVKTMGALEGTCILLLIDDRDELDESMDMKENLWGKNHRSMTQQTYIISKLNFSRAVFLGKRDVFEMHMWVTVIWEHCSVFSTNDQI